MHVKKVTVVPIVAGALGTNTIEKPSEIVEGIKSKTEELSCHPENEL